MSPPEQMQPNSIQFSSKC